MPPEGENLPQEWAWAAVRVDEVDGRTTAKVVDSIKGTSQAPPKL
jgi:hypothetical protein